MDIKQYLDTVCSYIKYKPIRNTISSELENHIHDLKDDYMIRDNKLAECDAITKAIQNMGNADEIGKRLNKVHRPKFDLILFSLMLLLISFGVLLAYSLSSDSYQTTNWFEKTIFYIVIGAIFGIIIYFMDYTKLQKLSIPFYILATIPILLSYFIGHMVNGVYYLSFGFISTSPITIALPFYIFSFVGFLNQYDIRKKKDIFKLISFAIFSLGIIAFHPSIASCFILVLVYIVLVSYKIWNIKNLRKRYFTYFYSGLLLVGIICMFIIMIGSPYRITRILASFSPDIDPSGSGWVAAGRKSALEHSKFIGKADYELYFEDTLSTLPELETNQSFTYLIINYGWIIGILITAAIIFFGIGISTLFITQSIFSILINLNLWVSLDINLPFISYGGINQIFNIALISSVLSIYRRKDILQ